MNLKNSKPAAEEKIMQAVQRCSMLTGAGRVVVGFSGGADSTALVHFLWRLGVPLLAAHVNHGLRGKQADADEQFVLEFCSSRQIPVQVLHQDVAALAKENGEGIEEAGRRVRYGFFQTLCEKEDKIATAHTLSDQAETVLLHLVRGAGAKGLAGIPPVRGNIIRPLIGVTRQEVEEYCTFYHLDFVTDQSNFSRDYSRNKIRLDVVPVLKELNPAFEQAVDRMTRLLAQDEDCLFQMAAEGVQRARHTQGYCISTLLGLPDSVASRAIRQIAQKAGLTSLSQQRVDAVLYLLSQGHGLADAGGGLFFRAEDGFLSIGSGFQTENSWQVQIQFPKTLTPDGREVIIRTLSWEEYENMTQKFHNLLFPNALDYDTIRNNSVFRSRRPGDFFSPAGRGVTKSLKKLLNEQKIPPSQRGGLLLLENAGNILWIEGIGAAEQARVGPDTKQIAYIHIKECNS